MSKMAVRVAKAIRQVEPHTFADATPAFMQSLARAAIAGMREPTLDMVLAGSRKAGELGHRELADEYTAMIDEALK